MPTLFLIVFVDLVGFGLVIPLLPFYALRFAASPQQVTVLLAIFSLMQLFTAPLWGRLSDRVGRRPVLMVSMAASVLAYLWIGSATALWMLFAARALAGACAGNIAAAQAYIADITKPEDRAKGMGLIGAAFGLGFIIGPALSARPSAGSWRAMIRRRPTSRHRHGWRPRFPLSLCAASFCCSPRASRPTGVGYVDPGTAASVRYWTCCAAPCCRA